MAWVSMREGLVQFDNSTQEIKNIGVIVSREATPPAYTNVKDLLGFYIRKTKVDGMPRTVYLSMTDKMTTNKFNTRGVVSIDGEATGFVSAIDAAPEILHPNTKYYAHFYEITGTTGIAIEKLEFKTEDFPNNYPTSRGTYSSFYNQITDRSSSPAIEYKGTESYLLPIRLQYSNINGLPYAITIGTIASIELQGATKDIRPLNSTSIALYYDLYNITPSGPSTSISLWDGILRTSNFGASTIIKIDISFGGDEFLTFENKKLLFVTE